MAAEIQQFQVSVAAGTPIASPQRSSLAMPARIVRRITVRIPPGPAGLVGFQIGSGGQQIIPVNVGTWIIADGQVISWDVTNQIESGAWQLIAYNLGTYAHTIYLTFEVDPPQLFVTPTPTVLIPSATLSGSAGDLPN